MPSDESRSLALSSLLEGLGNKWSYLLILELAAKPMRFEEIRREIPDVSRHILTKALRTLRRDGIVEGEVLETTPPGVQYRLSALGESLIEPLGRLERWAIESKASVLRHRAFFDETSDSDGEPKPR